MSQTDSSKTLPGVSEISDRARVDAHAARRRRDFRPRVLVSSGGRWAVSKRLKPSQVLRLLSEDGGSSITP
jgi:hypothetical protein